MLRDQTKIAVRIRTLIPAAASEPQERHEPYDAINQMVTGQRIHLYESALESRLELKPPDTNATRIWAIGGCTIRHAGIVVWRAKNVYEKRRKDAAITTKDTL